MTEDQILYISNSLLASAFYYGIAGGFFGCILVRLIVFIFYRVRSIFH